MQHPAAEQTLQQFATLLAPYLIPLLQPQRKPLPTSMGVANIAKEIGMSRGYVDGIIKSGELPEQCWRWAGTRRMIQTEPFLRWWRARG